MRASKGGEHSGARGKACGRGLSLSYSPKGRQHTSNTTSKTDRHWMLRILTHVKIFRKIFIPGYNKCLQRITCTSTSSMSGAEVLQMWSVNICEYIMYRHYMGHRNIKSKSSCENVLKKIKMWSRFWRLLMRHTVRDSTSPAPVTLQNGPVENVVVAPGHC